MAEVKKSFTDVRREQVVEFRKFHEENFKKLGLENPEYCFKMVHVESGGKAGDPKYIDLYTGEITKGKDIYMELGGRNKDAEGGDFVITDEKRTLYVWRYNPNWATYYKDKGNGAYLIPEEELIEVKYPATSFDRDTEDDDQDCPMSDMTLRDYAAITLNKPVSNKPWLNNLIKKK